MSLGIEANGFFAGFGSGLIEGVADAQRVKAIQELPFHGDLWAYAPAQTFEDGSKSSAEYIITLKGWQSIAFVGFAAAVYFGFGRR